ncbi:MULTISPECIES: ester cyclase [Halorussus]|uniref:ester cyclase n=1 Tax=Halorussus TaxID=1070314 RepID=UPI00209C79FF|nr:ester cyclase [Halorussus vallis]USZ75828.1 ester cyclase [Halorussus vallis]
MTPNPSIDDGEAYKQLVRVEYERAWGDGDLDALDETCSPNIVVYGLPTSDRSADLEAFKDHIDQMRCAFPDIEQSVDDLIAEDDRVVARTTLTGTHDGDRLIDIEPQGESVEVTGTVVYRIEREHIAEAWVCFDTLGLFQQLGAVPDHPQAYEWETIGE